MCFLNLLQRKKGCKENYRGLNNKNKNKKHLVWRDAQWLGVLTAALPKDQGSDTSTYIGWLCDQEL